MRFYRSISTLAIMAAVLGAPVQAQSLRNSDGPAEFPPTSYAGTQYVDSKGCVFVRTGSGSATQWVPRVTRSRKVICGYTPTQTRAAALPVIPDAANAAAPARTVATVAAPAPVRTTTRVASVAPVAATVTPSITRTVRAIGVPASNPGVSYAGTNYAGATPIAQTRSFGIPASNPTAARIVSSSTNNYGTTQVGSVRPIAAPVATVQSNYGAQPSYSGGNTGGQICSSYTLSGQQFCRAANTGFSSYGAGASPNARVGTYSIKVPPGYEPAWDDGRLNAARGPVTLAGDQQQAQIWTETVPAYDVNVDRGIRSIFSGARIPRARLAAPHVPSALDAYAVAPQYMHSSHRFVQIGTFAVTDNAMRARLIIDGLDFPSTSSTLRKGASVYIGIGRAGHASFRKRVCQGGHVLKFGWFVQQGNRVLLH